MQPGHVGDRSAEWERVSESGQDVDGSPGRVEPVGRVVVDVQVDQVQVGVPGSEGVSSSSDSRAASRRYIAASRGSPAWLVQRPGNEQLSVLAVVDVELLAEGDGARAELIGVVGAGKGSRCRELFEGVESIVGRGGAEHLDRFGQDPSGLVGAAGAARARPS